MSGFKNFAVVGAGNLGAFVVDELLQANIAGDISSVTVVCRSNDATDSHPKWLSQGVKFAFIDYDSPQTMVDAFSGIDVVISTVGGMGLDSILRQKDLAVAAKSSSVRLFVPSEFGSPSVDPRSHFAIKTQVTDKLQELNLPYTVFYVGGFADVTFNPSFGWDFANDNIHIHGDGNAPISFTTRLDIARFVSYVLINLPTSNLEWKTFRIEGDRISWNEIAASYEKKTGKKLSVTHTSRSALEEIVKKNPEDHLSAFWLFVDNGGLSVGKADNGTVWPEWKPKKVLDVLL